MPESVRAALRLRTAGPSLESNAAALMLSSIATGALGLLYWAVAERFFDTAEVGRASAVISSSTMLASVACLSLGGAYQRFLPIAGRQSVKLIVGGLAATGTVAVILGFLFLAVNPSNDRLFASTSEYATFPFMVLAFALYALTDPILIGLRLAKGVAAKNITLSVVKIIPVVALSGTGSALALNGSWTVLAFAVTAAALLYVFRTGVRDRTEVATLPPVREMWAFQGVFFTMTLVTTVTPLALPLIVVSTLGTEQNAYFNLAWTMCSAVGLLRSAVGSSFVVEASMPSADRRQLLHRLLRMLGSVTAVSVVGLAVGGPLILYLVGPQYFYAAATLVLIMAVDAAVGTVVMLYFLLAQILRHLRIMLVVQCVVVVVTVGAAAVMVTEWGLIGVGLGSLSAQCVAVLMILVPLRRAITALTTSADTRIDDVGAEPVSATP
ncbi:lipopolysaccharide biosynthesis protein [Rhodococcus sp. 27YEA15]|uniref:lipopolysaccharide biosynthesis protein n=1 Tax=Rhodococcus sp. 27YEA15 TaxID=3156259 RepID=UPI003C7A930C